MPEFAYVAVGADGRRIRGSASAANEDALAAMLRERDQYLLDAREPTPLFGPGAARVFERVTRRDLIFFTTQLATIVQTGVNLIDGLAGVEAQSTTRALRAVVADVRRRVESGRSLSDAMEQHPAVFDALYVAIIRAGEATGRLDRVLDDLVRQLDWQDRLAVRVREALTYPLIVVGLLSVLMVVLVGVTIPRFVAVYQNINPNLRLPWPTRVVQGVGLFVADHWGLLLAALAVAGLALKMRVQTPDGAVWWSRVLRRVPVFGEVLRKIALSRFAHYFGSLHDAGLDVVPSLSLIERVLGHPYLARRFRGAVQRVLSGESLSRALAAVGEFSPIVIQMVALGETTGQMSRSLQQVTQYYDRDVDQTVSRAITLFGPLALVVLAAVFVLIAVAFYLPLFSLSRAIQP